LVAVADTWPGKFCEKHLALGREEVPWHLTAGILVIARLCEPSSELRMAEDR